MKMLLEGFNAKIGRTDVFKPTTGKESLYKFNNDNGVRVVNFATSKNLTAKITMFARQNIQKFIGHPLMERLTIKLTIF
jgi:hypothetical protein